MTSTQRFVMEYLASIPVRNAMIDADIDLMNSSEANAADEKAVTNRTASWFSCTECKHQWIGMFLPMPISDVARIMKNATCPMCAVTSKKIRGVNREVPT